jgi:hypothetical protein
MLVFIFFNRGLTINTVMFCNDNVRIPYFQDRSLSLGTGVLEKKLDYFMSLLCNPDFSIPIQTNWIVFITPESTNLLSTIAKVSKDFDPNPHNVVQAMNDVNSNQYQGVVGCVFAQDIRLPGETISTEFVGGGQGFVGAPIITTRNQYDSLEIGFLETNKSFSDYFIRPWIITVGYKGLVARSEETSVKATFEVLQLGRTTEDQPSTIRKLFRFRGVAPIRLNQESLGSDAAGNNENKRQCSFVYSDYTITEN